LPNGLSINTTNGLISGTNQVAPGIYMIELSAINVAGEGTNNLTLNVLKNSNAPTITSASSVSAYLRSAFSFSVNANPGATSYGISGLPLGLTNFGGTIIGTPAATGTYNVSVTARNAYGSDSQILTLGILDPDLNLSTNSLNGLSSILGKDGSIRTYTISGSNLTQRVTITAPMHFSISEDSVTFTNTLSLAPVNGTLPAKTLYVRLATDAPLGSNFGTVTHNGGGALSQSLPVAGTVIQPQLSLSTSSLGGFSAWVGVVSSSQSYSVSGTDVTGGITVTAPAGFEISTNDSNFSDNLLLLPSRGILSAQRVYVRISLPTMVGSLSGTILHEGGDTTSQSLTLSGSVVQPSLNTSVASVTGGIKITYLQRGGVNYTVKSATNLATGFTGTVTPLKSDPQPAGLPSGHEQYEATLTAPDRGFLKVEAVVP
jgi:hypothetical protein